MQTPRDILLNYKSKSNSNQDTANCNTQQNIKYFKRKLLGAVNNFIQKKRK